MKTDVKTTANFKLLVHQCLAMKDYSLFWRPKTYLSAIKNFHLQFRYLPLWSPYELVHIKLPKL